MRKSTRRAVLALSAVTAVAGSVFVGSPAMAAPYPIAACGGGSYHVMKGPGSTHAFKVNGRTVATAYLLYNGKTNCLVTWKAKPSKAYVAAGIMKQGDKKYKWDAGNFSTYAGPVKRSAHRACIAWAAWYGNQVFYTKNWVHCG